MTMLSLLLIHLFFPLLIFSSTSDQWFSKSQCTQKEFANHMDINCNANEYILIGWSHYGTKKNGRTSSTLKKEDQQLRCEPSATDCIMDYTHKIAELCNGVSKCEVILTQQFIHKCSDEATYLFISYQCINNESIIDVCSQRSRTSSDGLHLISPSFPNEYPNNVNCTCSVEPTQEWKRQSNAPVMIDVESLSFNLQDNDYLSSLRSLSLSGTLPFGVSLITEKNSLQLTFSTDETLSQSGFWVGLHGYHQCHDDEYTLGSKCIRIFAKKQPWHLAEEKCSSIGARLIHLDDIVQEKKLTHFLANINNQQTTSFWISEAKDKVKVQSSWWPWRSSVDQGNCILRTQDGWLKRPCDEMQAFICEREINRQSIPLTVRCGNAPIPSSLPLSTISSSTTLPTTIITTMKTTLTTKLTARSSHPTVPFIQPPVDHKDISANDFEEQDSIDVVPSYEQILSSIQHQQSTSSSSSSSSSSASPASTFAATETKSNLIDPNILAAILGGIALAIMSVNIMICYLCKRRTQKPSKCKTPIESQSSFTHEELQRSLMQHLYHEQTNTISSTSTSSSKHSQSKSNDTSTTTTNGANHNVNLLQLCSPSTSSTSYITRSNAAVSQALCFRNPHATHSNHLDPLDYHVYETIPSESASYSLCASHSAFKPILQSNTHTFRPFLPRTNILYHPPQTSKQTYETASTSNASAVLMPVCCHHHHLNQCSTGTLRQHLSPRLLPPPTTQEQIYAGSESIV